MNIPVGTLAASHSNDDAALDERRRQIREKLLRGEPVFANQNGALLTREESSGAEIMIPEGKLAVGSGGDIPL